MGMVLGICVCGLLCAFIIPNLNFIILSQETGNDICRQITGNQSAIAEDNEERNLICLTPSFDETQHIIIKTNDK